MFKMPTSPAASLGEGGSGIHLLALLGYAVRSRSKINDFSFVSPRVLIYVCDDTCSLPGQPNISRMRVLFILCGWKGIDHSRMVVRGHREGKSA